MSDVIRISNVGYLNSAPYRALSLLPNVEYSEHEPAVCARMLHEGEIDLACLPLAELALAGRYQALEYGIAAEGKVGSVLLFASSPLEELRTIYFDRASQSSVRLLRVLLSALRPDNHRSIKIVRTTAEEAIARIAPGVGALLIGDKAFERAGMYGYEYDLSLLWNELTGLPFVFAVWAYQPGRVSELTIRSIETALARGVSERVVFARAWAEEKGSDRDQAVSYVNESIRYQIGPREQQGAMEFFRRAAELNLLPHSSVIANKATCPPEPWRRWKQSRSQPRASLDSLLERGSAGNRLSLEEGIRLAEGASLADLALAADERRKRLHPGSRVSYIVDRNINYTNVCNVYCRFCAFYRAPGKKDGYVLSREEIGEKIRETIDAGGIQVLLQGGLNPDLGIEYYEDLFRWIKQNFPVNLHALSSDEVWHIVKVSKLSLEETLSRLIDSGLGSLPGGGAEILVDRVRRRIARLKTTSEEWLEAHRVAHRLGLRSTCTMMFGVKETWEDRLLHLLKLRSLQDETGGFTAFITWPFQEENTQLKRSDTSAPEYLRVQAIARLFLDNITHLQSSWVTQGPSIGQIALHFGANDFGSVMFEENVVSAAGTTYRMNSAMIERHIREAGFEPWRRDVHYNELTTSA